MLRRLVVHAGFHKTGTSTLQKTLAAHRDLLSPHTGVVLRDDMRDLCEAARTFSVSRSEFNLGLVAYEAARLAEAWTQSTMILSSEDLSGHMPGRKGLTAYDATPALVARMNDTWRLACPHADVTWIYTTRAAAGWLRSCYAQHLRVMRMTLEAQEYEQRYAGSADLNGIIALVRQRGADVLTLPLETHGADLTAPVLASAGVPPEVAARVHPVPPANTAPGADGLAALLALNRSGLSGGDLRAAKSALRKARKTRT
ncbi:MAG: hypothetical protein AAF727_11425 [Pseudomonadota bacterium]